MVWLRKLEKTIKQNQKWKESDKSAFLRLVSVSQRVMLRFEASPAWATKKSLIVEGHWPLLVRHGTTPEIEEQPLGRERTSHLNINQRQMLCFKKQIFPFYTRHVTVAKCCCFGLTVEDSVFPFYWFRDCWFFNQTDLTITFVLPSNTYKWLTCLQWCWCTWRSRWRYPGLLLVLWQNWHPKENQTIKLIIITSLRMIRCFVLVREDREGSVSDSPGEGWRLRSDWLCSAAIKTRENSSRGQSFRVKVVLNPESAQLVLNFSLIPYVHVWSSSLKAFTWDTLAFLMLIGVCWIPLSPNSSTTSMGSWVDDRRRHVAHFPLHKNRQRTASLCWETS